MSNPVMVGEVNKLAGNLLAAGQTVCLPGIGTLRMRRVGAKRLSGRSVLPPQRVVDFSSKEEGTSLAEAIARAAGCDEPQDRSIYDRWLSYVLTDGILTIEGVGVLKHKYFTLDPAFDKRINPQGHEPLRIRPVRRFDWAMWCGIAAILVAAGFGGYQFLQMQSDPDGRIAAAESAANVAVEPIGPSEPADALAEAVVPEDSTLSTEAVTSGPEGVSATERGAAARPESSVAEPSAAPDRVAHPTAEAPAGLVSGRKYVVLGVFSTPENAARAVRDAAERVPDVQCAVYAFGAKWMVSPFEAGELAPCTKFVNEYGDRFPGLWVYTAR